MRISTTKLVGILIGVISAALLAGSAAIFIFSRCGSTDGSKSTADSSPAAVSTQAPTPANANPVSAVDPSESASKASSPTGGKTSGTSATSASDPSEAAIPADLSAVLEQGGYTAESLDTTGAGQLVVVKSSGTSAEISFFEKDADGWKREDTLTCGGYVGAEGAVDNMSEQISGTPKGLYPIGSAFYQDYAPETGLESFAITSDTYWVDDPDSAYYNQRVVGEENRDWNSAEHMSEIPSYRFGFVIGYNTPAEYNKGSAIFFHIGYSPTQGCVAASEDMVLAYLAKLSAARDPYILIV